MSLSGLTLPEDEVHLWVTFPKEIQQPDLLRQYHAMMNPDETAKQKRFHFEKHRHQYLLTRAVIRSLLSRYLSRPPAEWAFETNRYGRPHLLPALNETALRFNLSHSEGIIVCGLVRNREIGVDVEYVQRGGDLVNVADRFFSPQEVQDLHKLPEAQHIDRFFDYWTLKESYIKARGMGLSIPLDQFSFHLDDGPGIRISIDARQNDPPERWQFRQWRLDDRYKIALALERDPGRAFRVVLHRWVPLLSEEPLDCQALRNGFDR